MIDKKSLNDFRAKAINPERPNTRGTAQNEDTYFQCMEVRNKFYEEAILDVCYYMDKVNKICKTNYKPFNYYGADNPDTIIIAMGSVCDTIHETVSYLNDKYNKNMELFRYTYIVLLVINIYLVKYLIVLRILLY